MWRTYREDAWSTVVRSLWSSRYRACWRARPWRKRRGRGTAGVAVRGHHIEVERPGRRLAPPAGALSRCAQGRCAQGRCAQEGAASSSPSSSRSATQPTRHRRAVAESQGARDNAARREPGVSRGLAPLLIDPTTNVRTLRCRPGPRRLEPGRRRRRRLRRHPRRHRAAEAGSRVSRGAQAHRGSRGTAATSASMRWCRRAGMNHLTLVEAWTDASAQQAHSATQPTRSSAPRSGR